MRIVLDTTVLISGIFFTGPPCEILKAWKEKRIQFVMTAEIFDEYVRVAEILSNKYATVNPCSQSPRDGTGDAQAVMPW